MERGHVPVVTVTSPAVLRAVYDHRTGDNRSYDPTGLAGAAGPKTYSPPSPQQLARSPAGRPPKDYRSRTMSDSPDSSDAASRLAARLDAAAPALAAPAGRGGGEPKFAHYVKMVERMQNKMN
jgi:hypothetical protein